jgi:drug/metabolite transporter (DMT)-like permease
MPLPASRRQQQLAALAVATCGAMWGIYWLPLRWIDGQGVGAAWSSLIFSVVAMLAALPWMRRYSDWQGFPLASISGLLLGTAFALYTVSLLMTDVVHAILLFYLTPVWSTLGERLVFGQRLTAPRALAIVMGLTGVALILGITNGLPLPRNLGDVVALASGIIWAVGTLRSAAHPTDRIALPAFSFALGGALTSLVILVPAVATSHGLAASGNMWSALPWIILVALTIFVPPNALVMWATQRLDSGRVGVLLMTEAMMGSISAALLAGEAYGWTEAVGTILIVGAGLVEVLGRRDANASAPAQKLSG